MERIQILERVGSGGFGDVFRALWQGTEVAVKLLRNQELKTVSLRAFREELAILTKLRHPNIILFLGACTRPGNLCIVSEYVARKSLYRVLHTSGAALDNRRIVAMASDIARGVNYLHSCTPPIIHRDLKAENMLVARDWTVKVCDFGLSKEMFQGALSAGGGAVGTANYAAPEVLLQKGYDKKADVYSFGCLLWELVTKRVPWHPLQGVQILNYVAHEKRRLVPPEGCLPMLARLINDCTEYDPALRPTFEDILHCLAVIRSDVACGGGRRG